VGLDPARVAKVLADMQAIAATITLPPAERVRTFAPGSALELGGAPWTVLHLPGHAGAQTCFYQPDTRRFLASDMLLPITPTPVVDPPAPGAPRSPALPEYLRSLERVAALDIARAYPGHGAPIDDPRSLIQAQQARIARRSDECLELIRAGHTTIVRLFSAMYAGREASGMAAIWMLVGYTDLLLEQGRITVATVDGVWHFSAVA
jgi:glyoxylase-like metal-dependent hydrolase (beta-lactamase superfamily II)